MVRHDLTLSEASHIRGLLQPEDVVVAFEPAYEGKLKESFPQIILARSLVDVRGCLRRAEAGVCMRYHGAILCLKAQISCFAYRSDKTSWLFADLGVPESRVLLSLPANRHTILSAKPVDVDFSKISRQMDDFLRRV